MGNKTIKMNNIEATKDIIKEEKNMSTKNILAALNAANGMDYIKEDNTMETNSTKVTTAKAANIKEDNKMEKKTNFRVNMSTKAVVKTTKELSLEALTMRFPVVKVAGQIINGLQVAIDDGTLRAMVEESAKLYHDGNLMSQVKVLRNNLASKKTNIQKGSGVYGDMEMAMLRITTLDAFYSQLVEECGGIKKTTKYASVGNKQSKYDLTDEDIDALAECRDIAVLNSYYNSIASFKSKGLSHVKHADGNFGMWSDAAFARFEYMTQVIQRAKDITRNGRSAVMPIYAPKPNDWFDADEKLDTSAKTEAADKKREEIRAWLREQMLNKKKSEGVKNPKLTKKEEENLEFMVDLQMQMNS